MRSNIRGALAGFAIVLATLLSPNALAQQSASGAQISALESQKAALQAQQRPARSEQATLKAKQPDLQAEIARPQALLNAFLDPAAVAAAATGKAVLQGANPLETRTVEQRAIDNAAQGLPEFDANRKTRDSKRAELAANQARQAQLDAEIADRDAKIAALDAKIAELNYVRNGLKSDLESERAHLRALDGGKSKDDAGQLKWDTDNTRKRIEDLENLQRQYGQPDAPSRGASGGQPQPQSYNAPAAPSDGGPPLQVPPLGYVPGYVGVPPVYGAPVPPRWTDLNPPPRQRPGGPPAGTCAPPCHVPLDGSGGCHCPDNTQPSNSGTASKPGAPPPAVAQTPTTPQPPQQQGVRVNCYNACFNGCMANKGGSGYFQGMCAPEGPCYSTRVTPDACSKYCVGYKQDVLLNAGDPQIGVCGGK